MKSRSPVGIASLLLAAPFGIAFAATTYYVAPTGSDTGTCGSAAAPCKTIDFTLQKTDDGDTVLAKAGTYNECLFVTTGTGVGGVTLSTDAYSNNGTIGSATLDGAGVCDSTSSSPGPVALVLDGSTIEGFAIKHGGDGAIWGFGAVAITANVISGSTTATIGGGIYGYTGYYISTPDTKLSIKGNTIDSNSAAAGGGGIYVVANGNGNPSVVEIDTNTVTGNSSTGVAGQQTLGGGISIFTDTFTASDSSTVMITSNVIDGNMVADASDASFLGYGGGIFVATGASYGAGTESITVGLKGSGNIIRNNTAEGFGGGISSNLQPKQGGDHTILVEGNSVTANTAGRAGGGAHSYAFSVDLSAGNGSVRIQDNTLRGNHATGNLADIYAHGGGGLFGEFYSFRTPTGTNDFEISRNTITGNDSTTLGGGASLLALAGDDPFGDGSTAPADTTVTFANNLLATNSADDVATSARGGGAYVLVEAFGDQATATVDHDFLTVAGNVAITGSGGLEWDAVSGPNSLFTTGSTALALTNSIIVGNNGFGVGGGVTPGPGQQVDISYVDSIGNIGGDWESQLGVTPGVTPGVISVDPALDLAYVPPLCSVTIDAGDPLRSAALEPQPNGGIVNLGHLGSTLAAVKTFPDINGDGFVDGIDVLGLAVSFASSSPDPRFNGAADLDFNATIDGLDLSYLVTFYGQSCP